MTDLIDILLQFGVKLLVVQLAAQNTDIILAFSESSAVNAVNIFMSEKLIILKKCGLSVRITTTLATYRQNYMHNRQ
jgi:hypothetical protein